MRLPTTLLVLISSISFSTAIAIQDPALGTLGARFVQTQQDVLLKMQAREAAERRMAAEQPHTRSITPDHQAMVARWRGAEQKEKKSMLKRRAAEAERLAVLKRQGKATVSTRSARRAVLKEKIAGVVRGDMLKRRKAAMQYPGSGIVKRKATKGKAVLKKRIEELVRLQILRRQKYVRRYPAKRGLVGLGFMA